MYFSPSYMTCQNCMIYPLLEQANVEPVSNEAFYYLISQSPTLLSRCMYTPIYSALGTGLLFLL